jgi:hypothetical protein
MKRLPTIMLTNALTLLSFQVSAAELDSIELVTPVSYDRPSSSMQTVKSKIMAGAASTFNIDIEKKVVEKILPYKADLLGYFSSEAELNSFLKGTIQQGIQTNLAVVTDANLIHFYGYLGNNLIGKLADKILAKEGVTDPARRSMWIQKLVSPFNACVAKSTNSQYDASHCIDALTASLVPSTGVGLVYELSRASLSANLPEQERTPFNIEQANLYKSCITTTKATAGDVKNCALSSMRTGVLKVTDVSLTKTIEEKSSSKAKSNEIKKAVWPAFDSCAQKVGTDVDSKVSYTDQFMGCIDNLVQNAGSQLVLDKITNTPAIAGAFTTAEVKKLATEKSTQFKTCAETQKKKGAKKDGMLDISPCENAITNEVTYKVVSQTFKNTATTSLKTDPAQATKVGNEGVKILDQCWDNKQSADAREACLRKSIVNFSGKVATLKLDQAIPADMPGKSELNKSSVSALAQCIDKELPKNISESNELTAKLDGCTGKLTRNVAMKVADFQIRSTAGDGLSKEATDALVKNLVQEEFSKCIGDAPTDDQLEQCSNALTIKAAKQIAEASFTKEVNAYLQSAGGLKALGVTEAQVKSFLDDLNKTNKECIDQKPTGVVMDQVNSCIKGSVKKIAFFFGEIQFNKSVGSMYDGRDDDKKSVEVQFKKSLGECLGTKDAKEFSIGDYTKNLYTCSDKVSASMSLIVGQDQIDTSLNQYLKDRPGIDLKEKRDSIRTKLLGDFKKCMSSGAKQSGCIDNLKKAATQTIVVNYGRVETKVQMNADKTPAELKPVEDKFLTCTDSKLEGDALATKLDDCTKDFALDFARALGTLKLNYLLKQTLGTEEFNAQKKDIDASLGKYYECLDDLKSVKMSDGLTQKLSVCTDGLTNRGMNLVRSNINSWMSSDQKDAATVMIKQEFSNFLPCLSALLPTSPYTPELQSNIDSNVKPLANLIAHYIEYNPENAKQTLDGVIKKLSVDLNDVTASKKAKQELLDFLYQSGGLDQFIKAIVRGTVQDALVDVPEKDVPKDLRDILLKKENFEEIFNSPEGSKVKDIVMEKLLKPALIDGANMSADPFKSNMNGIKDTVVKLLINAPSFGEQAIKVSIQKQINDMGGVTKFFAKSLYGGDSLHWDKVRLTPEGKIAEEYIKSAVLTPKFKGEAQSPAEAKKAMATAQELVTRAVKKYGKK